MLEIYHNNNINVLNHFIQNNKKFNLIYIDPPYNTGKIQKRTKTKAIKVDKDNSSDEKLVTGYKGNLYKKEILSETSYNDKFDDFISFIKPRCELAYNLLEDDGSFFFQIDYREAHYCKVMLDEIFGRVNFINEIIWSYDYGARSKKRWSCKHDNIFWYAKNKDNYVFNYDKIDRIPYLAPDLVGEEKAKIGKTPTDVWWNTIVSPNGKEKTGYATQKPLKILERIVKVHSKPNDNLMDFFAGSGSFGEAAHKHNRNCVLIDENIEAINIMKKRFNL